MSTTTIDRVTIYCAGGVWCYAAWFGPEHDHNDTLPNAKSEDEARLTVSKMFPGARIVRVEDVL